MPVGEKEGKGKGAGVLQGGRVPPGSFLLRVLKARSLGEVLGEDLNRIFMSFPGVPLQGPGLHWLVSARAGGLNSNMPGEERPPGGKVRHQFFTHY